MWKRSISPWIRGRNGLSEWWTVYAKSYGEQKAAEALAEKGLAPPAAADKNGPAAPGDSSSPGSDCGTQHRCHYSAPQVPRRPALRA